MSVHSIETLLFNLIESPNVDKKRLLSSSMILLSQDSGRFEKRATYPHRHLTLHLDLLLPMSEKAAQRC